MTPQEAVTSAKRVADKYITVDGGAPSQQSERSVDDLVIEVRRHIKEGEEHQLRAGLLLLELRRRIQAGEAGAISWWAWYERRFKGYISSRKYAEQLMRWARSEDPVAAIEAHRTKSRERGRAKAKRLEEISSKDDEPEAITVEDELEPDEYRESFLLRAADALAFAVYSGEVDEEVIAAAQRVATTWQNFTQTLKARRATE